jgi:hypothetical protein
LRVLWTAGTILLVGCTKADRDFILEFIGRRAGR